ncbi:hypothetical protein ABZ517_05820 [Streptomyces scabiei]|uniref:hypothetical protein n=1 Tax=Streptomyces scabiei TaxID=1930 RepID=UPI0033E1BECB
MAERTGMNWTDEEGTERKLWKSGAERLKYVASRRSGTGRFQMPPGQTRWNLKDIRAYEDQGLWRVTWLEEDDTEREGAWRIDGLTEKGANLLADWERRVEGGGGLRGPKRNT